MILELVRRHAQPRSTAEGSGAERGSGAAPVPDALLATKGLGARYGSSVVLHDVDLHVRSGEIVTLLGANGAGKTTFLNTVMGLVTRRGGRVLYEGADITRSAPEERVNAGISISPEGRRIFGTLTVEENLRLGAGRHQDRMAENLDHVLELFPKLGKLRRTRAGLLSGGEQQQLALGRALMSEPRLLLLDEPSLGLAPKLVATLFGLIARLRDEGVTILLVEQNARLALDIADRGYVLNTGRIELSGSAGELQESASVEEAYLGLAARP
jgi:branched-chain amino acid transport system ATP-binding protein